MQMYIYYLIVVYYLFGFMVSTDVKKSGSGILSKLQ